jgi:hypothetical protein
MMLLLDFDYIVYDVISKMSCDVYKLRVLNTSSIKVNVLASSLDCKKNNRIPTLSKLEKYLLLDTFSTT